MLERDISFEPDFIRENPRLIFDRYRQEPGGLMVKLALPNGTINHLRERIKTNQRSWDSRIPGR
jgi:hypothetical protein